MTCQRIDHCPRRQSQKESPQTPLTMTKSTMPMALA